MYDINTSAPWSAWALAASASFGGSNHVLTQMILSLTFGLLVCAPRIEALMPEITKGIGNGATHPGTPVFETFSAIRPWR